MNYKIREFLIDRNFDENDLENFLNTLTGEIVSIFPNLIPKFHTMGATAGYEKLINFTLV